MRELIKAAILAGVTTIVATAAAQARGIVETVALCVQGSLMRRYASAAAADAFCASRLGAEARRAFGALALDSVGLAQLARRARLAR